MSEWVETTLGEVAQVVRGVTFSGGDVLRDGGDGRVAVLRATNFDESGLLPSADLTFISGSLVSDAQKVQEHDVLVTMSTGSRVAIGKSAVMRGDVDAAFGGFLAVIRPSSPHRVRPRFLGLVLTSPEVREYWREVARGTSIKNLNLPVMNGLKVTLPSLAEQRRIVDVVAAVDVQIEALVCEVAETGRLLRRLLADHFEAVTGTVSPVADLCSNVIGGIWGSPEGESEVDVLALGPRIYTPGTSDFVTDGSPVRSFSAKQVEVRLVQPDDIILERSGGSPEQPVGRVVIAGAGLAPCIPTDFQRLMRPDPEKVEPRYLYWRLQHDWNAGLTRNFSRKTTGITNLSVKDYIARGVPVPSPTEQGLLVAMADEVDSTVRAHHTELARLRVFRSTLLSSLLNQEIEIPESYDSLLEGS